MAAGYSARGAAIWNLVIRYEKTWLKLTHARDSRDAPQIHALAAERDEIRQDIKRLCREVK